MKSHDILVLVELLRSGSDEGLTYQRVGQALGIASSQVFDSVERCAEIGLLGKDRKTVDRDRFISLLQHAMPYLFPLRIGGPARGIPLVAQAMDGGHPGQSMARLARLVWPSDEPGSVEGLAIDPLDKRVPALAASDSGWHRLLSCTAILRLVDHPLKGWAREQVQKEVEALGKRPCRRAEPVAPPGKPLAQDPEVLLDVASQLVSQYGFRQTRLSDIAGASGFDEAWLRSRFASEGALFEALHVRNMKAVGALLGRMAIVGERAQKEDLRELMRVFLEFLERNESWFRLMLWTYLEAEAGGRESASDSLIRAIDLMARAIASVVHGPAGEGKADPFLGYALISISHWYGFFLWADSRRIADRDLARHIQGRMKDLLANEFVDLIISSSARG